MPGLTKQIRNTSAAYIQSVDHRPAYNHFVDPFFLEMDFTGTEYDTKAECQYRGLRFSDSDTPWPAALVGACNPGDSWTHSAGNGWQPAADDDTGGPALLIPLMRPDNWILELQWKYAPAAVTEQGLLYFGYITNSNQPGAYARIEDTSAAASQLEAHLDTNDGDDTYTERYNGAALAGAATRTYRFRCMHGCVSVWDDQDDAWHDYEGRYGVIAQIASVPYTAAWAFVQTAPPTGQTANFWTAYLAALKLSFFY